MITITEFTIASDFKTMTLTMSTDDTSIDTLSLYIGSDYLQPLPIDLTSLLSGTASDDLTITLTNAGLSEDDIFDGIFTVYVTDSATDYIEAAISNLYYISLTLANMIITKSPPNGWNDINTIWLLLEAIKIFLASNKIEQGLNAYERTIAMTENDPNYLVTTDSDPCVVGAGCWIINGTYIIS